MPPNFAKVPFYIELNFDTIVQKDILLKLQIKSIMDRYWYQK